MTEQLIELRQKSNIAIANGDYKCNFEGKGLFLEEGDEVVLSNAFIDNANSSDYKITLTDDTVVKIGVLLYNYMYDETAQNVNVDNTITNGVSNRGNLVQANPQRAVNTATSINDGKYYKFLAPNPNPAPTGTQTQQVVLPQNQKYFLCREISFPNVNFHICNRLRITPKQPNQSFGGLNITIKYFNDSLIQFYNKIVNVPIQSGGTGFFDIPLDLIVRRTLAGGIQPIQLTISPQQADLYNIGGSTFNFIDIQNPNSRIELKPVQKDTYILFRAGSYTPQEIALKISNTMTSLQPLFDSQGNILNETRNIRVNTAEQVGALNNLGSTSNSGIMVDASDPLNYSELQQGVRQGEDFPFGNHRMVAEDGTHAITFTSSQLDVGIPNPPGGGDATPPRRPAPRIIGSTNFSMEYDDDMKKYKFVSLHTDFFGFPLGNNTNNTSQTANSCFQFFRNNTENPAGANDRGRNDDGYYLSSQGGCCIVDLEPHDFWFGSLGFKSDLHVLQQNFTEGVITSFNENINPNPPLLNTPCRIPTYTNLNLGETYTCGARSLTTIQGNGAFVDGNTPDSRTAQQLGHYANANSGGTQALKPPAYTFNYDIVANETFLNNIFTNGYYLIEISGLPNTYKGKNLNKNNVMAIVSRYYNTQNYTIGDESNSVIYQHKGESISINNLNVRVLLPDGNLAPLQDDNTVFLKIRKADLQQLQKKNKSK